MPSALPGAVAFVVLLAAVLTFPLSLLILALYRRAVRRSMRTAGGGTIAAEAALDAAARLIRNQPALGAPSGSAERLYRATQRRPWAAAGAYAIAAASYGVAMAAVVLLVTGAWGGPIRLSIMALVFAWPVLLTAGIVAAPARRVRVALGAAYFATLLALGAIGTAGTADGSPLGGILLWALYNGPATLMLVAFLARRIRAVGPLVFVFLLLSIIGANAILGVLGASEDLLRTISMPLFGAGFGATQVFLMMAALGAALFAVAGWGALIVVRRLYESKAIGDESVTVGTLWLIFALAHSIGLYFETPIAALAGVGPFLLFVVTTAIALGRSRRDDAVPPRLLLLRSFSIGAESERLFDAVDRSWRRAGSIQMIAGYDLASRTVEPHEFLDFVSGRLARRFIDGSAAFERRLTEMDLSPDRDGRFRINDFFCYDDTWRMVLRTLVRQSHAVLMDLRGFTRDNAGCIVEIHELFRVSVLGRVVFVVDHATDDRLLRETLRSAAAEHASEAAPQVYRLDTLTASTLRELLRLLAAAAYTVETVNTVQPRDAASA